MRRANLFGAAIIATLTGCANHYVLPAALSCRSAPADAPKSGVSASAVEVDITPPIGLSIYGHGLEGRIASGLLTHLRCRGFVFRTPAQPLAWLACDLQSMSLALQRRVAELVQHAHPDLGADRIVLSATHTHAGPGHFLEGRAYETPEGGSRWPAYDQRVVDFLAIRMADAIDDAYGRVEPVTLKSTVVPCVRGISRNRSMPAFLLDPDRTFEPCTDSQGKPDVDPAHAAVPRELTIVRVDRKAGDPLGVLAVYAVHNTTMPNTNELYHGDLFAFASAECERLLSTPGQHVVCAIANGAEGDVSPDWAYQDVAETRRLGGALGRAIVAGFGDAKDDPAKVESRYAEILMPNAKLGGHTVLCDYPNIGAPAGGGAPDGPTRLRIFEQLNPGMINPNVDARTCSGDRIEMLGIVPSNVDDYRAGWGFPPRAPMSWLRLGSQAFIALPGEPTTMAGCRIRKSAHLALLHGAAPPDDGSCRKPLPPAGDVAHTTVVGLTGGYISYFATPEEYAAQYYEGASTIYGKRTVDVLADRTAVLAAAQSPAPPVCVAAQPAAIAGDPSPQWPEEGGGNPDARGGPQPKIGVVGEVSISPAPVSPRWPASLRADRACYPVTPAIDPAALSGAQPYGGIRWVASAHGAALEADWIETPDRPLCGASAATLLEAPCDRPADLRLARTDESGDEVDPEKTRGGDPIDDEHAAVVLRYDFDGRHWTALRHFAKPPAVGACYRFAIRTGDGVVHATASVPASAAPHGLVEGAP